MSDATYDDEIITQYLLGSLREAEIERLDELSITDNEFAETLRAAEKDLVDAYVQGELSGTKRERFESHYLGSPVRREQVKFAQAFQEFGTKAEVEQVAGFQKGERETSAQRKHSRWFSALILSLSPRPALQWGMTFAAFFLLISGGFLLFQNIRLRQQMSQTAARRDALIRHEQDLQKEIESQRVTNSQAEQELARVRDERERLEQELTKAQQGGIEPPSDQGSIVSLILAPPLRGAGQVPTLSIRPGTNQVAAQLQIEAADYSAYRVALIDPAGGRALWQSGNLKPGRNRKMISVKFPARLLKSQNYSLRVSGVAAGGASEIVSDYPFKVVK